MRALEDFDTGRAHGECLEVWGGSGRRGRADGWDGRQLGSNSMHSGTSVRDWRSQVYVVDHVPMKRSSEHEVVVASELAHARMKLAVVDETARFADYEERKHHPGLISKRVSQFQY